MSLAEEIRKFMDKPTNQGEIEYFFVMNADLYHFLRKTAISRAFKENQHILGKKAPKKLKIRNFVRVPKPVWMDHDQSD